MRGKTLFLTIPLLVLAVSIFIAFEKLDPLPSPPSLGDFKPNPTATSELRERTIDGDYQYQYGRYRFPFLRPLDLSQSTGSMFSHFTSTKRWHFVSLTTDQYFIGAVVINLNYVGTGFVYVYDKIAKEKFEWNSLSPLAYGVKSFSNCSAIGCSEYRSSSNHLKFCFDPNEDGGKTHSIFINAALTNKGETRNLEISWKAKSKESLVLLYPIESNRPVYVHKEIVMPAYGEMKYGNLSKINVYGLSGSDWTMGLLSRVTKWKWAHFQANVTRSDSDDTSLHQIGINFSDEIYNDDAGISQENFVILDGVSFLVGKVIFQLPPPHLIRNTTWSMQSAFRMADENARNKENVEIDLKFIPHGTREEIMNLGIVTSNFVQLFGVYNGYISINSEQGWMKYEIVEVLGVAEDHFSKW